MPFYDDTNTCTNVDVQLAGIPVRDEDVFKLAGLLRSGGFEDVADKLTKALLLETKVLALTVTDRESILRALHETRPTGSLSCVACCSPSTSGECARGLRDFDSTRAGHTLRA